MPIGLGVTSRTDKSKTCVNSSEAVMKTGLSRRQLFGAAAAGAVSLLPKMALGQSVDDFFVAQPHMKRPFRMSQDLREELEWLDLNVHATEEVISALGEYADNDFDDAIDGYLAQSVNVFVRGKNRKMNHKAALKEFRLLKSISIARQALYEENRYIVKATGIGLAAGTVWIEFPCADNACNDTLAKITALNIR
jgi:hypothetical protein